MQDIVSVTDLDNLLLNNAYISGTTPRLFVIDFYADWCGPCRMISPLLHQMAVQYKDTTFIKVNVDHAKEIAMRYGVRAMPTFVFIKMNQEIERLQGANPDALQSAIQRHQSVAAVDPAIAIRKEKDRAFLSQFADMSKRVEYYKDVVYRTLALSVVPYETLQEKATVNGIVDNYLLAKALLEWFKMEFFTWCDSPNCNVCGKETDKTKGTNGKPTPEESRNDASRVEVYPCDCGNQVRFPRYNNPGKLLETRTGRCGEWANCFTLIAAALDFDVRFVYDVTDHVWTELWIPEMKQYVHCDPCENIIDQPLIYELGWGKKLSYVIGFGLDHAVDVTWRYVDKQQRTLKRRKEVEEATLTRFLRNTERCYKMYESIIRESYMSSAARLAEIDLFNDFFNKKSNITYNFPKYGLFLIDIPYQAVPQYDRYIRRPTGPTDDLPTANLTRRMMTDVDEERKLEIELRRCRELSQMISIGKPERTGADKYAPRTTGSLEWRKARGELGNSSPPKKIVLRPDDNELSNKQFVMHYDVVSDRYSRGSTTISGWQHLTHGSKNVQRKVETDWKKAYLCRKDGQADGKLTWAVDLTGVRAREARVSVRGIAEFEKGSVVLSACADDICMQIPRSGELKIADPPSSLLKITAVLSGGSGDNAFQHAQMLRSELDDHGPHLVIEIDLDTQ